MQRGSRWAKAEREEPLQFFSKAFTLFQLTGATKLWNDFTKKYRHYLYRWSEGLSSDYTDLLKPTSSTRNTQTIHKEHVSFWVYFIVKSNMKMFLFTILLKSTHLTLKGNNPTIKISRWVSDMPYKIMSSWASKTPANLKHIITFFLCVSQKLALGFPQHCRSNQHENPASLISSLCMKLPSLQHCEQIFKHLALDSS